MKIIRKTVLMLTISVLMISICFSNKVYANNCSVNIVSQEAVQGKNFTISINIQENSRNICTWWIYQL